MESLLTVTKGVLYLEFRIEWEEFGQDPEANTSRLRLKHVYARDKTGTAHGYWMASNTLDICVDGRSVARIPKGYAGTGSVDGSWKEFRHDWYFPGDRDYVTGQLQHDENGEFTARITLTGSMAFYGNDGWDEFHELEASGELALGTLPRATKILRGFIQVGQYGTEESDRVSLCFEGRPEGVTHTLSVGSAGTERVLSSGRELKGSYDLTGNFRLAELVPGTSAVFTARLETFRAGESLGVSTLEIPVTVLDSAAPTLYSPLITDASEAEKTIGSFVQNVSRPVITVMRAVPGVGAQLRETKIYFDGSEHAGTVFRAPAVSACGTVSGVITAVDSRGRTAQKPFSIEVLPYELPKIIAFDARRCDARGSVTEQGNFIRVDFEGSIADLDGQNRAQALVLWRPSGSGGEWEQETIREGSALFPADPGSAYEVCLRYCDRAAVSTARTRVATVYSTIDLKEGGKGICFGGVAQEDGFHCRMPADFTGGVCINGEPLEDLIRRLAGKSE